MAVGTGQTRLMVYVRFDELRWIEELCIIEGRVALQARILGGSCCDGGNRRAEKNHQHTGSTSHNRVRPASHERKANQDSITI